MTELHPHLAILRCPRTRQPLRPASDSELAAANANRVRMANTDGPAIACAVTSVDGRFVYPVVHGAYILMAEAAIAMEPEGADRNGLTGAKAEVQRFYDQRGWSESASEGSNFVDEELFEDVRCVSAEYRRAANQRVADRLAGGRYLLDAASGPIQYDDYLAFSAAYDIRVCIDFSVAALRGAAAKLGDKGLFVLGDVTNLPIADCSVDAVVSLHTIYHVPPDDQATVFTEFYRVLAPGGRGVIVYQWKSSPGMRLFHLPLRIKSLIRQADRWRTEAPSTDASLYFAPHTRRWFRQQPWPFTAEISTWRTLTVAALRGYVPDSRWGARVLGLLRWWETQFPRLSGRVASYPLITFDKP